MSTAFLDTNVLLRHLLGDDPDQSPRATAFLHRVEQGELTVRTSEIVVFETVFTLQRREHLARSQIRDAVLPLIELPGVLLEGKRQFRRVFDLYVEHSLSFADAHHVAMMERLGIEEIVTFDRGLDGVAGIRRIEP